MKHLAEAKKIIVLILFLVIAQQTYPQKAFEQVFYTGKTKTFKIKFILAGGYLAGSEIIKTDNKTKLKTKFYAEYGFADKDNTLKFVLGGNHTEKKYFILSNIKEEYNTLPKNFEGFYFEKNKKFKVLLNKDN